MKKKRLNPQTETQTQKNRDNKVEKREQRGEGEKSKELVFSFKYYGQQIPPAQSFREWENDTPAHRLFDAIEHKLVEIEGILTDLGNESCLLILQDFIDFIKKQIEGYKTAPQPQSLLVDLLEKLVELSKLSPIQAQNGGYRRTKTAFGIYGKDFDFKGKSAFTHPSSYPEGAEWAAIKRIGGKVARVGGCLVGNVFYIFFLDKEHKFYSNEEDT